MCEPVAGGIHVDGALLNLDGRVCGMKHHANALQVVSLSQSLCIEITSKDGLRVVCRLIFSDLADSPPQVRPSPESSLPLSHWDLL